MPSITQRSKPKKKSFVTILVHWFSAILVFSMFASIWSRQFLDEDMPAGKQLLALHKQMGILILCLLLVRLLARQMNPKNTYPKDLPRILFWAGQANHFLLYLTLLVMPLLGWGISNASGHAVIFLGFIPLPTIVAVDTQMAETLHDWHEIISWVLLGLLILHISAALWHHFVRKDQTLAAIVPWLQRKQPN
jgi:cytochrome b561